MLTSHQWALCRAWARGGRFGLALVGDSWGRERLLRELSRRADAVHVGPGTSVTTLTTGDDRLGRRSAPLNDRADRTALAVAAVDTLDPQVAAAITTVRILASAPDWESIPVALRDSLTVVVGVRRRPVGRPRRIPPGGDDVVTAIVRLLDANSLCSHRLDLGAVACVRAVGLDGAAALDLVARFVVAPRLPAVAESPAPQENTTAPPHTSGTAGGDGTDELTPDQAECESGPPRAPLTAGPGPPPAPPARRTVRRILPGRRGAVARDLRGRPRGVSTYHPESGVAVVPTLVGAAREGRRIPTAADLRSWRRVRRGGRILVVILDRSDSMGGLRARDAAAFAERALRSAVADRCELAVIAARGARAELSLAPTRSLHRAHRTIRDLSCGGGTPLASAFELATDLVRLIGRDVDVRCCILTDGAATVRLTGDDRGSAVEQAERELTTLAQLCTRVEVIPCAHPGMRVRRDQLEWLARAGAVVAE
ncbi:VWA domain-containing protein [Rhodococcus triatomae]|uniref:VWA domain-containing protein n=1 Tax=Rhodococcus triatomae TaxID=300028 RepID=UPI001475B40A|nr:VWA domain-containing protein [Rhodococcus triatomae]QNG18652.1 VWA domain-containing protein [Rhodococcus triatomae]QNG21678.1 VWA domain-containing protein [Rhodococcus triatomae]